MKNKIIGISICIILMLCIIIQAGGTRLNEKTYQPLKAGDTLYVGGLGPGNYSTIQGAINDANDGDTVFVYDDSSPYNENLVITKSIDLIGENKMTTVIHGGGGYYYYEVIYAIGENIVISDFTIENGAIGLICEINNSQISNLIIDNTYCAIYLYRSSQNTISDNLITSCYEYCIYVYDHSADNIIVNNLLPDQSTYGITLYGRCDKNQLENNLIENKENGMVLEWSFFNVIKSNNFINNSRQAYFDNSSFNFFFKNHWNDWLDTKPRPIEGIRTGWFLQNTRQWTTYDLRPIPEPYAISITV